MPEEPEKCSSNWVIMTRETLGKSPLFTRSTHSTRKQNLIQINITIKVKQTVFMFHYLEKFG